MHLFIGYRVDSRAITGKHIYLCRLFYRLYYPCMWPCMVYFTYIGLRNLGLNEDATRIAKKYIKTVRDNFEKTGELWEKYDARNGSIASTDEYQTPSMLGWTAGVYSFLIKELR